MASRASKNRWMRKSRQAAERGGFVLAAKTSTRQSGDRSSTFNSEHYDPTRPHVADCFAKDPGTARERTHRPTSSNACLKDEMGAAIRASVVFGEDVADCSREEYLEQELGSRQGWRLQARPMACNVNSEAIGSSTRRWPR